MSDPVAEWAAGLVSAPVALARMVIAGLDAAAIEVLLPAGSEIASVFDLHRGRLAWLASMLRDSGAAEAGGSVEAIRAAFDRAVSMAPEASVAAYSLGDASLLDAATQELVGFLRAVGAVWPDCDVLDVGCGIGRVAEALAPLVRSVSGTDVSAGMVAQARLRCASFGNVRFEVVDGAGASRAADASADLVLFVDSMPYLVEAGVEDVQIAETARVLRAGGRIAVFNLSYRGEATDERLARGWAERFDWELQASRPFTLWDGRAFVFTARRQPPRSSTRS